MMTRRVAAQPQREGSGSDKAIHILNIGATMGAIHVESLVLLHIYGLWLCLKARLAVAAKHKFTAVGWRRRGVTSIGASRPQNHAKTETVKESGQGVRVKTWLVSASNNIMQGPYNGAACSLAATRSRAEVWRRSSSPVVVR